MEKMTLSTLTSKEVRIALKRHVSAEELCGKYDCTNQELVHRVEALFKSKKEANDIVKQLQTNRRQNKPAAKKEVGNTILGDTQSGTVPEMTATAVETVFDELAELKAKESELSRIVMDLENDHVALASEHRGYIKRMRSLDDQLVELKTKAVSIGQEYDDIVRDCNVVIAQMNELSAKLREERDTLDGVRTRIGELEQIIIAVSANDVELLSGPVGFVPDDSGAMELARDLWENNDLCSELKKREIHLLAKVLKIIEHTDQTVEIIFDSEELQTVYELYLETKVSPEISA